MSNKEERMNRNKSIIEDYKNGKSIIEIAREYNLSETMCYKILKGTQEPPRYFEKKRKKLTTRNEQIVKQYKGGMTARELGKILPFVQFTFRLKADFPIGKPAFLRTTKRSVNYVYHHKDFHR